MSMSRRQYLKGTVGVAAGGLLASAGMGTPVAAQARSVTLRHVLGASISSLDPTLQGATRESFPLSANVYDRLASFERKAVPGGFAFDFDNIRGELAERIDRSNDGLTFTFHIRDGAMWHDGSPVEPADIKWSLDRAATAPTLAKSQMSIGSQTNPDQFKVVGDRQVEIKLDRPDRLALATHCVSFLPMFNSKLAKKNATSDDPWAINWLKDNAAGGGAYSVESNRPGQQLVLRRNDKWKNGKDGKLPYFERVIVQTIPDVSSRASLIERGDADITLDAAANDIPGIEQRGRARVFSTPQDNAYQCVSFNTTMAPFNDVRVRRALSLALPYDDMFKAALFGRGRPLYGATGAEVLPAVIQPMANKFDLDQAKRLLADAGFGSGFKTTFSFQASLAPIAEPIAALVKESFGKLGIEVSVQKFPDAQFATMAVERKMPMLFDFCTAWLPSGDYVTRVFLSGSGRWNSSAWSNEEVTKITDKARYELDQSAYQQDIRQIAKHLREDSPVAMLWQPAHDAVMGKDIDGYTYWYHRGADYRDLRRV